MLWYHRPRSSNLCVYSSQKVARTYMKLDILKNLEAEEQHSNPSSCAPENSRGARSNVYLLKNEFFDWNLEHAERRRSKQASGFFEGAAAGWGLLHCIRRKKTPRPSFVFWAELVLPQQQAVKYSREGACNVAHASLHLYTHTLGQKAFYTYTSIQARNLLLLPGQDN